MPFSVFKIGRVVLAIALAFWVAGAGCLLGCEGMIAVAASQSSGVEHHATDDVNLVVSSDACASAKSHDCCAKKQHVQTKANSSEKQAAKLVDTESSSSGMSACPLAMGRTAVAAKNGSDDQNSTTTVAGSHLSIENFAELTAPLAKQVRLPNRGHTYLRCCSFLI